MLNLPHTVVTYEYPADWKQGDEPYYPVNDAKNGALYEQYRQKAAGERNVIFGGWGSTAIWTWTTRCAPPSTASGRNWNKGE